MFLLSIFIPLIWNVVGLPILYSSFTQFTFSTSESESWSSLFWTFILQKILWVKSRVILSHELFFCRCVMWGRGGGRQLPLWPLSQGTRGWRGQLHSWLLLSTEPLLQVHVNYNICYQVMCLFSLCKKYNQWWRFLVLLHNGGSCNACTIERSITLLCIPKQSKWQNGVFL